MNVNYARIELLNKKNYDTWKLQMQAVLVKNDLWEYVNGTKTKPDLGAENANAVAVREWEKNDQKAISDMILSISPSELKQVKNCDTSHAMWTRLKEIYQSQGPARKATLLKKLTLHKMATTGDVRDHMNEFFDTVDKLGDMDIKIHPDQLAIMLLYSLPANFENFRCAIESRDVLPTPEALRAKIIEENDARNSSEREMSNAMFVNKSGNRKGQNRNKRNDSNSSANDTYEKSKKNNIPRCKICKKPGHTMDKCWYNDKNKKQSETKTNATGNVCFHSATSSTFARKWCLDSGASSHLIHDLNDFYEISVDTCGTLNLANDTSTKITGKGTGLLTANVLGNKKSVTLTNASHVPDLRTNLLSIGKITDRGYDVIFRQKSADIVNTNGQIEVSAERVGDLYFVREFEENACAVSTKQKLRSVSLETLHRQLGHANSRDITDAVRKNIVTVVNIIDSPIHLDCDICKKGKMTRAVFAKKTDRKSEILDIIHTDICGPMRINSLGGARYFVEFIDDASRWCIVKFLKAKNEVFETTKEVIALMENQTGKKVKSLQSDNGREYLSHDFDEYLKSHGITRRLTIPHNPEQNGIAERRNRTLLDMARCLLLDSKLPTTFWAEAVATANYLRNRLPTKSLDGKTPHEIWVGDIPDISHLKIFGTPVIYLDRDPGKGKFDQRGHDGIFLGYSSESKGLRIWSSKKNQVIISRDVEFVKKSEEPKVDDLEISQDYAEFEWTPSRDEKNDRPSTTGEDIIQEEEFHGFGPEDLYSLPAIFNGNNADAGIDNEEDAQDQIPLRGPGRPSFARTGRRGRPRKLFCVKTQDTADFIEDTDQVFIAEIPMNQAMSGPDAAEWFQAMSNEMKSILKNDTWVIVDRPAGEKVIGCRMVLRNKLRPDGTLERRKARLVAQGFNQIPGIHFSETFAPVARPGSIRLLMAIAARFDMRVRQFDVATAYLNGDLKESIFMETPKNLKKILTNIVISEDDITIKNKAKYMLNQLDKGDKVCSLKKSLYGLRQAGRSWYSKLNDTLKKLGATPSQADPCLFQIGTGEDSTLIATYVDDILVASRDKKAINDLGSELGKYFELKDLGYAKCCLGIEIVQENGTISLHQRGYVQELLERFNMAESKPVSTPFDTGIKLVKMSNTSEEDKKLPYRELVGALTYLSTSTRPDIAFAVSCLGQFNNCFGAEHWRAAKRVLRYLKGTSDVGLVYGSTPDSLRSFVDSDWGSCTEDRRSFTGFLFLLHGSPISWDSRKQRTVALSTTEAEYMALSECAKEAIYLQRFIQELGFNDMSKLTIFCDNRSALRLVENPIFHAKSKHIDIKYHFVRDAFENKSFAIKYIPTEEQIADFMTKALPRAKHAWCSESAGLKSSKSRSLL